MWYHKSSLWCWCEDNRTLDTNSSPSRTGYLEAPRLQFQMWFPGGCLNYTHISIHSRVSICTDWSYCSNDFYGNYGSWGYAGRKNVWGKVLVFFYQIKFSPIRTFMIINISSKNLIVPAEFFLSYTFWGIFVCLCSSWILFPNVNRGFPPLYQN